MELALRVLSLYSLRKSSQDETFVAKGRQMILTFNIAQDKSFWLEVDKWNRTYFLLKKASAFNGLITMRILIMIQKWHNAETIVHRIHIVLETSRQF